MNENKTELSTTCQTCHKELQPRRLTIKLLINDIMSTIFNLERGVLFTIWELIKNPRAVINAFVSGNRHRYMNPFRLMILAATLAVITESITGTIDTVGHLKIAGNDNESTIAIGKFLKDNINLIVLATVPVLSIGSFLIFRKPKWNFAEHLSINAYAYSVAAIAGSLYSYLLLPFEGETRVLLEGVSQIFTFFVAYVYIKTWSYGVIKGALLFLLSLFLSMIISALVGVGCIFIYRQIF
jgi:hypothetical protein